MVLWRSASFQTFGIGAHRRRAQPGGRCDLAATTPAASSATCASPTCSSAASPAATRPLPRPLRRRHRHRPDVPRVEDARGRVARRTRPARDRPRAGRPQGRVHAMQARQPDDLARFFTAMPESCAASGVFMIGAYNLMYDVAKAGLERGVKRVRRDSAILTGGGAEGHRAARRLSCEPIHEFLGVDRIQEGYGFSEQSAFHWACAEGRYHVQPWVIPFVLDPDTSEPLPRTGTADRPGRRSTTSCSRPTGAGSSPATRSPRLGPALPVRADQRRVRARHHPLQREAGRRRRSHHLRRDARGPQRGRRLHEGVRVVSAAYTVPLFLRGELITDDLVSFGTRGGEVEFQAPDMRRYVDRLPLASPMAMADLYDLGFRGDPRRPRGRRRRARLRPQHPPAGGVRGCAAGQPAARANVEEQLPDSCSRCSRASTCSRSPTARSVSPTSTVGFRSDSPTVVELRVRAFGSRVLHIPAGNGGLVSAVTDPAVGDHPLRHDHQGAVERPADRDGDRAHAGRRRARSPDHQTPRGRVLEGRRHAVEEELYRPRAHREDRRWGGLASVKHVTRYIQPGLELIALDPKRSATIIGARHFDDDATMRDVARARGSRHRRGQPGGLRQRPRHLRAERHRSDAASPTPTPR